MIRSLNRRKRDPSLRARSSRAPERSMWRKVSMMGIEVMLAIIRAPPRRSIGNYRTSLRQPAGGLGSDRRFSVVVQRQMQLHEVRDRTRSHLFHDFGAMDFDSALAQVQIDRDHL